MTKQFKFYKKFVQYENLMGIQVGQEKKKHNSFPLLISSEMQLSESAILVDARRIANYIKRHIRTEKVLLSFVFGKMFFEESEEWLYLPIASVAVDKKLLQNGLVSIPFDHEVVFNEMAIKAFFNLEYDEGRKDRFSLYIGERIEDFFTGVHTVESFLNGFQKPFIQNMRPGSELELPEIVEGGRSAACMIFHYEDTPYFSGELERIEKSPSPLLKEYLTYEQDKNEAPAFDHDIIWSGALTKDFPLGKGQATVLQQNQLNKKMIAVEGAPGTGKSTLFLSIIAQEIVKRALTIAQEGQDYSNLILVTSTSNKAISNVYEPLKKGFKHGFVYVGGNNQNKKLSKEGVNDYIQFLSDYEYSREKEEYHKKELLDAVKRIENKRVLFEKLREIPFDSWNEVQSFIKNHFKKVLKVTPSKIMATGEDVLKQACDLIDLCKIVQRNPVKYKASFFKRKAFVESFNGKYKTKFSSYSELEEFVETAKEMSKADFQDIYEEGVYRAVKRISSEINGKEYLFEQVKKSSTFAEFYRKHLNKSAYSVYMHALHYMGQLAAKEKDKVLKAVRYFLADKKYEYIISNYGKSNIDEFYRYLSLAYPVTTSTLASVGSMFPGLREHWNLILADEAGMITTHSFIPAVQRAKRAIVVGDPKQLEPISSVPEVLLQSLLEEFGSEFFKQYSPSQVSAYHRAAGTKDGSFKSTGRGIVLDEHRRCAPKIARLFINIAEYNGLNVCTKIKPTQKLKLLKDNLFFFNVQQKNKVGNVNQMEINKIESILNRLSAIGYDLQSEVGIITPYKAQEKALIEKFGTLMNYQNKKNIGTVHKFQGVEYKVILFSTVVSAEDDSLDFINSSPSMINVAISRVKEAFMVIGDFEKLTENKSYENFAGRMALEIKANGIFV